MTATPDPLEEARGFIALVHEADDEGDNAARDFYLQAAQTYALLALAETLDRAYRAGWG